jgi:hypothetical protein
MFEAVPRKPQTARSIAIGDLDNGGVNEGGLVVFARYSGRCKPTWKRSAIRRSFSNGRSSVPGTSRCRY